MVVHFVFTPSAMATSYKKNNSEVWFRFKNELHKILTSHFPSRFDLINCIRIRALILCNFIRSNFEILNFDFLFPTKTDDIFVSNDLKIDRS